jgi:hypothetical protein
MPFTITALNGVRNYELPNTGFDKLADLRTVPLANSPNWVARAVAIVFGAAAAFDGSFFFYAWDATSVIADDASNYIKPTAITGAGRWRLMFGSSGGGLFAEFLAGPGAPEGVVTGSKQGQTYVDLDSGTASFFLGTVGTKIGWNP